MKKKKTGIDLKFSINEYDYEGDIYKKGIFIHIDQFIKIPVGDLSGIDDLIKQLESIKKEIKEEYPIQK